MIARAKPEGGAEYVHGDERVREAWGRVSGEYLQAEEGLEPGLARRFRAHGVSTFLELGGGNGPISQLLAPGGVACTVVDLDPGAWDGFFRPAVIGDLRRVPARPAWADAVSAINCLYFLDDPREGIKQAFDALRPGGLFVAGAPSRYHDVELRDVDPNWGTPSSFDGEDAERLVADVFGADAIEVEEWEYPACYLLPTRDAIVDYLIAFGIPDPEERAQLLEPPVGITKKGTNVWAIKP